MHPLKYDADVKMELFHTLNRWRVPSTVESKFGMENCFIQEITIHTQPVTP